MPFATRRWPFIAGLLLALVLGWSLFRFSSDEVDAFSGDTEAREPGHLSSAEANEEPPPMGDDRFLREIVDRKEASDEAQGNDASHQHVKRSWQGSMHPSLLELGEKFQANELTTFVMPTFSGDELVIEIHRFEKSRFGGGVLRGEVEGYPGSLVSLTQVGQSEAGSIHIPTANLVYEVRPGPEGTTIFSEIDALAIGECSTCIQAPLPHSSSPTSVPIP